MQAFRQRQQEAALRFTRLDTPANQILPGVRSHGVTEAAANQSQDTQSRRHVGRSRCEWHDSAGDTLEDLGVDEEAEEDNVPLAELLRRRKIGQQS